MHDRHTTITIDAYNTDNKNTKYSQLRPNNIIEWEMSTHAKGDCLSGLTSNPAIKHLLGSTSTFSMLQYPKELVYDTQNEQTKKKPLLL